MPFKVTNQNIDTWEFTATEVRAAIAATYPEVSMPDMGEGEGDDLFFAQGGNLIGLMDHHGPIHLTAKDVEPQP